MALHKDINPSFLLQQKDTESSVAQEPNLWGGGNGGFPFYCQTALSPPPPPFPNCSHFLFGFLLSTSVCPLSFMHTPAVCACKYL